MRIAFLCSEYPPHRGGGIGTFTQALARKLVKVGVSVDVIGIYPITEDILEDDHGVRVWRLSGARLPYTRFLRNGWRMTQKLKELRDAAGIDLVEGHEIAFAPLGRVSGVKRVIRMNGGHHFFAKTLGGEPSLWRGWQERRSFALADALCAVSHYVAETTRQLLKLGPRVIPILPNPVCTEQFSPRGADVEEPGLIVFAGTICKKKGVENLIRAFQIVLEKNPKARLVLAGRDQNEPGIGSFRDYVERNLDTRMRRHVEFLGPIEHNLLPDLYARAQVCVFPSLMEAQGIVFVEAMAMGKALVAPRIPPVCEMIEDGEQALICDPHDPESIAAQLLRCLSDEELRHRLGRNGRARVMERYSTDVLVRANLDFYRRVIEGRAS